MSVIRVNFAVERLWRDLVKFSMARFVMSEGISEKCYRFLMSQTGIKIRGSTKQEVLQFCKTKFKLNMGELDMTRVSRKNIKAAIAIAKLVSLRRSPNPAILAVRLHASKKGGNLLMSVTDLTTYLTVSVNDTPAENIDVAVNAAKFFSVVNMLDEEIVITTESDFIALESGGGKAVIPTIPTEEIPTPPEFAGEFITTSIDPIVSGINFCFRTVSNDPAKKALCGIHILKTEDGLRIAGTDGHRASAAYRETANAWLDVEGGVMLPTSSARVLQNMQGACEIALDSNILYVKSDSISARISLEIAMFPDLDRVIPNHDHSFMFVREDAILALHRCSLFAPFVKMSLSGGILTLKAASHDGGITSFPIKAIDPGADFENGASINFFIEALEAIKSEVVKFTYSTDMLCYPYLIAGIQTPGDIQLLMPANAESKG